MKVCLIEEDITGESPKVACTYKHKAPGCWYFRPKSVISKMLTEDYSIMPVCGMCIHYGEML